MPGQTSPDSRYLGFDKIYNINESIKGHNISSIIDKDGTTTTYIAYLNF